MADKPYVGDIGTVIDLDCDSDVTDATAQKILVKKPNGTEVEWMATIVDSTKLRYIVVSGDLDQPGVYSLQTYIESPTWSGKGETFYMDVAGSYR